jgi:hypothetical protein
LYARHLLLAEIGEAGQERLCAGKVVLGAACDARAASVARDYLERAGLSVRTDESDESDEAAVPTRIASSAEVRALAGRDELAEAAAALCGAFGAVEAIKAVLGVGRAAELPRALSLAVPTGRAS